MQRGTSCFAQFRGAPWRLVKRHATPDSDRKAPKRPSKVRLDRPPCARRRTATSAGIGNLLNMGICSDLCRREILLCAETRQCRGQRFRCARRGMRGKPVALDPQQAFLPRAKGHGGGFNCCMARLNVSPACAGTWLRTQNVRRLGIRSISKLEVRIFTAKV